MDTEINEHCVDDQVFPSTSWSSVTIPNVFFLYTLCIMYIGWIIFFPRDKMLRKVSQSRSTSVTDNLRQSSNLHRAVQKTSVPKKNVRLERKVVKQERRERNQAGPPQPFPSYQAQVWGCKYCIHGNLACLSCRVLIFFSLSTIQVMLCFVAVISTTEVFHVLAIYILCCSQKTCKR